jgi:hypothetical protein
MNMIAPEVWFEPLSERITEDSFRLWADKRELKSLAVGFPNDAIEGFE